MTEATISPEFRIVVVGGGSTGWIAAAVLTRMMRQGSGSVQVVSPAGACGIGVGEASVVSIHNLLLALGADEADFMRRCDATYKLGIRFRNWHVIGRDYWHPFGVCGASIDGRDMFHVWRAHAADRMDAADYSRYSLNQVASLAGKGPHSLHSRSPLTETRSYGFHFNAQKLAEWLRDLALGRGAVERTGRVSDVSRGPDGDVTSLTLTDGSVVAGDLFLDCSGFQSVLMEAALLDPFLSYGDQLLCDRAVTCRLPAQRTLPPYTLSTAAPAGWIWQIPLTTDVGLGYVYSSGFTSDDEAWRTLAEHAELDPAAQSPHVLRMRAGRQQSFWKHNVIALGLAGGFVEPLESTGLHLSQLGVEFLLKLFPSDSDVASLRLEYNRQMSSLYDDVRDFIQLHYTLSQRGDTEFWNAARRTIVSDVLAARLELYDDAGVLDHPRAEAFTETSYYHILTGNQRLPRRAAAFALAVDPQEAQWVLQSIRRQTDQVLRDLPLHEELLNRIHRSSMAHAS